MSKQSFTRRDFMKASALGAGALALAGRALAQDQGSTGEIPRRRLGRTGVEVSILGLGGHHLGTLPSEQEAVQFTRTAIDNGVTFMDNAWEYHNGRSEEWMGTALQDGYREKAFLMTKHHGRKDKATAMKHLEDSLRRLKTDHLDLWQYHEVVYPNDPEFIFSQGGAIEAAYEARDQGKVRFIGFIGHKDPAIFKEMLSHDFQWDTVQMPINPLDAQFQSFEKEILPILQERDIACIAMKTMSAGNALRAGIKPEEALRYAWSQPVATIVSGMDSVEILEQNMQAARTFSPMPEEEQQALLARTKQVAQNGQYEPYKTTRHFDGPVGREIHGVPQGA